jgi:hypothetical protein
MNTHAVGAELFNAGRQPDEQTDMTKLIVGFRNCTKAPKIYRNKKWGIIAFFL